MEQEYKKTGTFGELLDQIDIPFYSDNFFGEVVEYDMDSGLVTGTESGHTVLINGEDDAGLLISDFLKYVDEEI